jgi:hypothetical protein
MKIYMGLGKKLKGYGKLDLFLRIQNFLWQKGRCICFSIKLILKLCFPFQGFSLKRVFNVKGPSGIIKVSL